ncbi:MAG TPA: hypothetical protein VFF73_11455 [Planctomycetota bacterium]|nr:hypothetical protein [Planctomycetota bacterium]
MRRANVAVRSPEAHVRACLVRDCPGATSEGKPYCLEHLGLLPYVGRLARREREAREAAGRNRRRIDPRGIVARDILDELEVHGDVTPRRLAQGVALNRRTLGRFLVALEKAGLVSLRAARGGPLVGLRAARVT